MLGSLLADDIEAFILTSHLPILPTKGDFSDWMDLQGDNIDAFLELVERDRASQKSPDQAYLEQFGIKPASDLMDMEFGELNRHNTFGRFEPPRSLAENWEVLVSSKICKTHGYKWGICSLPCH